MLKFNFLNKDKKISINREATDTKHCVQQDFHMIFLINKRPGSTQNTTLIAVTKRQRKTILLLLLLLSGNIEMNPGPTTRSPTHHTVTQNLRLNANNFDHIFAVSKSRGDGHCFLYSVLTAIKYQNAPNTVNRQRVSYSFLLRELKNHVERYCKIYADKLQLPVNTFNNQFKTYIEHKVFDLDAIDLLPFILATVLQVKFCIIEKNGKDNIHLLHISPIPEIIIASPTIATQLYVLKTGEHYDGLTFRTNAFENPQQNYISGKNHGNMRNRHVVNETVPPTKRKTPLLRSESATSNEISCTESRIGVIRVTKNRDLH